MSNIDKLWEWKDINLQEIAALQPSHNIYVVAQDKRDKTYSQVRFMYAILGQFSLEYNGTKSKDELDELKNNFYTDYARAVELPMYRTKTASVTQMRMFLDWLIKTLAVEFGFTVALDLIEEDFKESWIYANTCARICCITGQPGADICHVGRAIGMGRDRTKLDHTKFKVISLSREMHTKEHSNPNFLEENNLKGVTLSEFDFKRLNVAGNYVDLSKK